jgi:SLT domain-containing protein
MSSIFQKAYDAIKAIKTPTWLKVLLGELQVLMFDIAKKAGQNYVAYVEGLIIQAAGMTNLSNKQKFEYVFDNARKSGVAAVITLKDNELNVLINFLYSQWKKIKGE